MVNTRILEQRLGWRSAGPDQEPTPPARPISHAPMLQGRLEPGDRGSTRAGPRRLAVEDAWGALPRLDHSLSDLATRAGLVPPFDRNTGPGDAFDQLRTQLTRVLKSNDWRRIGVTSPARGAGRSFVAAGLAASMARLDTLRVLLIDADLEDPGLAELIDTPAPGALEDVLTGARDPLDHLLRIGDNLAIALNGVPIDYGAELLQSPDAILALRAMMDALAPDVTVLDMPPLLQDQAAQALLAQLDAVLLISDGTSSTAADIMECERLLDGQVPLLGVALNKSEDSDTRRRARRRF